MTRQSIIKVVILLVVLCVGSFQIIAQQKQTEISLWPNGAPGFENRKDEPPKAQDWWMKNIHNPSLTVYPAPADKATGTSVIICPGGGHRELVITAEGKEAAEYLNSIGVTAFVLKYRLANDILSTHPEREVYCANIQPHRMNYTWHYSSLASIASRISWFIVD